MSATMVAKKLSVVLLFTLIVVALSGYAAAPYRYTTQNSFPDHSPALRQGESQNDYAFDIATN